MRTRLVPLSPDSGIKNRKTSFPKKIWQHSRSGPANLDEFDRSTVRTWTKLNPKWPHEILTQYSAESYVRENFIDQPDIVEMFIDLQDPVLRADMIRYLVLLKDGGLYADLDTKSLKPIDDGTPIEYSGHANMVIGIEYDKLKGNRWFGWTLDLQFPTWTMLAQPGHPIFK